VSFRRGARYLRPQPRIAVANAAVSFRLSTELPSANNPYEIKFDFEDDVLDRNRIAVLIGRNGTGKTQLLLSIIQAHQQVEGAMLAQKTTLDPLPSFNRLLVFSSVASDSYPRSIPPWHGLDYQYFSMIASQPGEEDPLTGALIDCLRDDGKIKFLDSDSPFARAGRAALLEKALESLNLSSAIYLPLKIQSAAHDLPDTRTWNGRTYFPLLRRLNEQRQLLLVRAIDWSQSPVTFGLGDQPRNLSSGELAMLRFAAQAAGSIEHGCMLLFDEPETHLHPNFISDFMSILHSILAATKSVAIIVTHSAYVVREVPRQRVRILSLDNRTISIDEPRFQTFGASIDGISQFIFGDSNIAHRYQTALREWVDSLGPDITIDRIVSEHGESLNPETLSYIANLIQNRPQ
jgi:ABC-type transporter Mla maintaining outer membrane lipid asymmetry ATPase subunit MlaF